MKDTLIKMIRDFIETNAFTLIDGERVISLAELRTLLDDLERKEPMNN